jgi:hypothetical protein
VDGPLGGWLLLPLLVVQDGVTLLPEFLRDDRRDLDVDLILLRFQAPILSVLPGIVGSLESHGCRVAEESVHRRVRELRSLPGPESLLVEHPSDRLLPPVLQEEFVDEFSNC